MSERVRVVRPMTLREAAEVRAELILSLAESFGNASPCTSSVEDAAISTKVADYLLESGWVVDRPADDDEPGEVGD